MWWFIKFEVGCFICKRFSFKRFKIWFKSLVIKIYGFLFNVLMGFTNSNAVSDVSCRVFSCKLTIGTLNIYIHVGVLQQQFFEVSLW